MSDFAVVIGFKFDDEQYRSIVLDTLDDVTVNGQSRVTEQPMVSGDTISDHMYNQPKTMSIKGTICMNDSKVTVIDGKGSKLANFQELFERINKEGVKCDIVKISINNDDDIRFLHRQNMVLQSYGWVENINSLDYSLNFKEILTVQIKEYDVDPDDNYLPNVSEPNTLSFTTSLIDWDTIDKSIIKILKDNKLVTDMFLQNLGSLGIETLKAIVGAVVVASIVGIMAAIGASTAGIGLVIIAAVYATWTFVKGIWNFFSSLVKQNQLYQIRKFTWTNNDKKNEAEIKRFADFIDSIHKEFEKLNDVIHIYQMSSNEDQECMIGIGDNYYIFTFTKNNVDGNYSLLVKDVKDTTRSSKTNISSSPVSFDQLNNNNQLFIADNNASVYLLFNKVDMDTNEEDRNTQDPTDLRNYLITVCDFNVEDFQKMIEEIIKSKILKDYK